jgi:hypothetical protein
MDIYGRGLRINLLHEAYLGLSFRQTLLVDANGVNPDGHVPEMVPDINESLVGCF